MSRRSGSRIIFMRMMQAVLRVQEQALSLIIVRFLLGRHRRRGVVPETEARAPETKRLRGWEWLLLPALRLATSISVEALQKPRRLNRSPGSDASIRPEGSRPRTLALAGQSSERPPWLRSVKSSEMEAPGVTPSLRRRMRSLWSLPR